MTRTLTDAEAAVIGAAVDLDDLRQEYARSGYRPITQARMIKAQAHLREVVVDLHNENDGRWNAP